MENISLTRDGTVLLITIDRPNRANTIDPPTSLELSDAFALLSEDDELRVAVVTGRGERHFCAGSDLLSISSGVPEVFGRGGFAGLTALFDLNKPVIAAVNGVACGGGFELALACDQIIAADHSEFFLPEVANVGVIPDDGGALRLPRRLPYFVAMEMLLTGRRMKADEGFSRGLVNKVVKRGDLLASAMEYAQRLAKFAPLAVQAIKEIVCGSEAMSIEQGTLAMQQGKFPGYQRMLSSKDYHEGAKAFAERREPRWLGR